MTMRLLFVDDEPKWVSLVQDAVKDWNAAQPGRPFELIILDDAAKASQALTATAFDGALLDLKLPRGDAPNPVNGSDLAIETLARVGIPVGILSGNPDDRDDTLKSEPLVRCFVKKADICDEIIAWFGAQWPMMSSLRTARETLHQRGIEVFRRRIWPRWEKYGGLSALGAPLDRIVTRQFASHIAELMGIDGSDNPDWHPLENYVNPALLDHRPHTGDLYRLDGELWIILTPQCDMANATVTEALMARVREDAIDEWDAQLIKLAANPTNEKVAGWFRKYVNQNIEPSRHFLAPLDDRPLMVDFRSLRMEPMARLYELLGSDHRIASVAPPFLANLTQRFGTYMARPGQPNIDVGYFAPVNAAKA